MANTSIHPVLKISGYLEKKAKMRIGSPWKKYWFVLEARLLLYYRSKDEYETLSPCKGSINLCPPCNVRPALSAACVFQIECRASTITLRAENRQEQDRWMQAILTSIAHSKSSPSRMSHFRYSLDDLPKSSADDKAKLDKPLSRQNTMPHRISSSPKSETKGTIIERLQNIGAQTYGGSLSTITKLANKDIEKTTKDSKNHVVLEGRSDQENGSEDGLFINSLQHSSDKVYSVFVENEHYSIIQEENSMELRLDEETNKLEKSSDNQSILTDNQASTENDSKDRSSLILENDQYIYSEESAKFNIRDQEAKTIEHFYERISTDSSLLEHTKTNEQETPHQNGIVNIMGQAHEYSVPVMDSNKNRLLVENDQYIPTVDDKSNDNEYSDGLIYTMEYMEYAAIDKTRELEELYEDPDYLKRQRSEYHDMEPILPPRPDGPKVGTDETSSQTSSNEGRKSKPRFKLLSQFMKFDKKPDDKAKPKRRKNSFLHKVWKRKTKSLDSENDITYDTVDYEIIEKQITKDKKDLEMLQELQKILETRKTMLQVKLNGNEKKTGKLKPITDSAKQSLENSMENQIDKTSKKQRPSLPPRHSTHTQLQQYDTVINSIDHQTNQNTTLIIKDTDIDSKRNGLTKNIKTIDEILKDLDKEKDIQESRQKVKQLIDKFNDIHNEDEVILRRKLKSDSNSYKDIKLISPSNQNSTRESDELSMLLEQLSKVTSAPVLAPGATSSLVNPILTEEEWLTLIPIRRRRLSEPDYDVPRPHRSLQLHNPLKQIRENPIPITRFFGPVLPPSSADDNGITTDKSIMSLDPDSLELENLPDIVTNNEDSDYSTVDKNYSVGSYTSHDYSNNKIIYAQPKPIIVNPKINNKLIFSTFNYKKTTNQPIETNRDDFIIIKSEEVFADSLEPHVEISTTF